MSLVDGIQADVRAMTGGLGRAQQETAAADHAARQIAQRAAASGFMGMAQSMARVCAAISEIHGRVSGLSGSVRETGSAVAAAPSQPSPQDTIASFTPLPEKLSGIHAGIGGCIERIDQAKQVVGSVLQGGQPGPMLNHLDAIRQVLVTVSQHGAAAKQHVETALSEARNTGSAGN